MKWNSLKGKRYVIRDTQTGMFWVEQDYLTTEVNESEWFRRKSAAEASLVDGLTYVPTLVIEEMEFNIKLTEIKVES